MRFFWFPKLHLAQCSALSYQEKMNKKEKNILLPAMA